MHSTMFRILGAVLAAALVLSPACSPPAAAQQKMINLNMGSTSSTSAVYAWCVATANVINKANVGLNVTVVESGAALDNLRKLKEGAFDFALSIDIPSAMQMVQGIDSFKGQPWKDVRVLFIRNVTDRPALRAQRRGGQDLHRPCGGKKFSPGIPGRFVDRLHDEVQRGAQGQHQLRARARSATPSARCRANRIVGLQKTSPVNAMDASLIEVNLTTPVTVPGFYEGRCRQDHEGLPYIPFIETAKGSHHADPGCRPDVRARPDRGRHGVQRPARERGLPYRQILRRRAAGGRGILPGREGLGPGRRPLQICAGGRRGPGAHAGW